MKLFTQASVSFHFVRVHRNGMQEMFITTPVLCTLRSFTSPKSFAVIQKLRTF